MIYYGNLDDYYGNQNYVVASKSVLLSMEPSGFQKWHTDWF